MQQLATAPEDHFNFVMSRTAPLHPEDRSVWKVTIPGMGDWHLIMPLANAVELEAAGYAIVSAGTPDSHMAGLVDLAKLVGRIEVGYLKDVGGQFYWSRLVRLEQDGAVFQLHLADGTRLTSCGYDGVFDVR